MATCPSCGATVLAEDRFCEACGGDLPPGTPTPAAAPACDCGGAFVDGWCDSCGQRAPDGREHLVEVVDGIAGVTDRGRQHARNEDAMAIGIAPDGTAALVVCDGVSSTVDPHVAALDAAVAARDRLLADPGDLLGAHAAAARAAAAVTSPSHPELGPPSCTFLAAVTRGTEVTVASLGDCRAFWVPRDGEPAQLTVDDSWAQEQIEAGMDPAEAHAHPNAHVITRWLGADADPGWQPRTTTFTADGPGRLVLCSDGLWNYLADPAALRDHLDLDAAPVAAANALVEHANAAGGHDNITVLVTDLPRAATHTGTDPDTPS